MNATRKNKPAPKRRPVPKRKLALKRKPAPKRKTQRAAGATYDDFMTKALAMEQEAAERYDELADQMDVHNNPEVSELFRKMAEIERKHAVRVLGKLPAPPAAPQPLAPGPELPESVPTSETHYLMPPYRALELALESEERARDFFEQTARTTRDARVKTAATELAAEEREHVRLIKAWMERVPKPEPNWDYDPDPPHYSE